MVAARGKRRQAMEWQYILAIVIVIPIVLFPPALVWYLNIGGFISAVRQARERRDAEKKKVKLAAEVD
jgi:hypothetical protein